MAEALLDDGCFVFMSYAHDSERAERIKKDKGCKAEMLKADLSEYQGAKELASQVCFTGRKLDYLVLNSGITDRSSPWEIDEAAWEKVMRANASVPFFLIKELDNRKLLADEASILCVSSLMAEIPHSSSISYGVSKAAFTAIGQNLAKFLPPRIRINVLEPGFVDTPWQMGKSAELRARIEGKTLLGRFALPDEIARLGLAIMKNGYMTGEVARISGGYDMA
jgi:3-oxoacyl-[acyl-carrier protein] reductase